MNEENQTTKVKKSGKAKKIIINFIKLFNNIIQRFGICK